jgi:hypothetical protein
MRPRIAWLAVQGETWRQIAYLPLPTTESRSEPPLLICWLIVVFVVRETPPPAVRRVIVQIKTWHRSKVVGVQAFTSITAPLISLAIHLERYKIPSSTGWRSLDIAVVGGGIGDLAVAISLRCTGDIQRI